MDKLEFIKQRCEIDNITEEEFEEIYRVVKCDCGMPYCKGYRCLDIDDLYNELKKKEKVIEKAKEYIKDYMPYLLEPDKEYENVDGNTYFIYKEWTGEELLQILEDKEVE